MINSAHRSLKVNILPQNASSQPFDLNREILASDLGKSAKLLMLTIADHARHGRSSCTASTGQLARGSGVSVRHVRNLLPALESAGWIQIERATGSRQSKHTIFLAPRAGWVPFVKLHECTVETLPRKENAHEGMIEVGNFGTCSRQSGALPFHIEGSEKGDEFAGGTLPRKENTEPNASSQPTKPLRFPHPPGQRDQVAELVRDLAGYGCRLGADGRLGTQPGYSECRSEEELPAELRGRLAGYRARIAAAGGA
jgi:hypothetical protein